MGVGMTLAHCPQLDQLRAELPADCVNPVLAEFLLLLEDVRAQKTKINIWPDMVFIEKGVTRKC